MVAGVSNIAQQPARLVQQITPEVLQWIVEQARAGHKPEAVLQAMRVSGWSDDVASAAIEWSRRGQGIPPPAPVPVPEPDPTDSRWILSTSDREVRVLASMRLPRAIVFGDLLSEEECDGIIQLAHGRLERSTTVDSWSGGSALHDGRSSEGTFFDRGANPLVARIEARIAALINWPVDRGEGLQVLRYGPGAEYRPHHDYCDPTVPGAPTVLERGGQRVATVVMYLNAPLKGGSTTFPDVAFQVAPMKGNAVFFSYDRPHAMTKTLHGGAPVIEGEKWVATKWLRERTFV
jgi:prolyl 4-hydroxylase